MIGSRGRQSQLPSPLKSNWGGGRGEGGMCIMLCTHDLMFPASSAVCSEFSIGADVSSAELLGQFI